MDSDTYYSHGVIVVKRGEWKTVCVCVFCFGVQGGPRGSRPSVKLEQGTAWTSRLLTRRCQDQFQNTHTHTHKLLFYLVCLLVMFDQDGQVLFQGPNKVGGTLVGFTKQGHGGWRLQEPADDTETLISNGQEDIHTPPSLQLLQQMLKTTEDFSVCEVLILAVTSHVIELKPFGLLLFRLMINIDFFTDIQYPDIAQHLISETGINRYR